MNTKPSVDVRLVKTDGDDMRKLYERVMKLAKGDDYAAVIMAMATVKVLCNIIDAKGEIKAQDLLESVVPLMSVMEDDLMGMLSNEK